MDTVLTTSPAEAAEFIQRGGLVAFPTETVYGLGADVFDAAAVERIFAAKRRPNDNPLIAHVGSLDEIRLLTDRLTPAAERFIAAFFPGPLTIVVAKAARVPAAATAGLDTIGVRMPRHELAREFLRACGTPVVAPSANLSGRPSPTRWEAVYEDLDGRIDCILQGAATEIGLESTVVDCTSDAPLLLRAGAVGLEELQRVVPETRLYRAAPHEPVRSPGLKHKHYAPRAKVLFFDPQTENRKPKTQNRRLAFIGLQEPSAGYEFVKVCASVEEYAREVFAFFRECDRRGVNEIHCEPVAENGLGLALMDRLRRAAEG